jgi:hypothetical protein
MRAMVSTSAQWESYLGEVEKSFPIREKTFVNIFRK